MKQRSDDINSESGSTIILVMIMTATLSLIAASLLRLGSTERKANQSQIYYTQAQNAAETMVEYGFAELKTRWERQTSFPMAALRSDPLTIPSSAEDFFDGTEIVFDDLHLVGGNVPPGERHFIDPNDPANFNDPQKGKEVFSRGVQIFGRAVVDAGFIGTRDAYCSQTLLVRDAPLFLHAVFYNMDLEFHPGPEMDMQGPVHSNGDIFVQAVRKLRFFSTLNSAGDLIYGSKSKGGDVTQSGTVQVQDAVGNWVSFYTGEGDKKTSANYYDSAMGSDWRETATNRWDGNVSSSEHGVPKMNAVGISDYVPDDPSTLEDEKYNPAFALIEPLVDTDHYNYKGETVAEQQFAYKAGLIFEVSKVVDASAPGGYDYELQAYRYDRSDDLNPKSAPVFTSDDLRPEREYIDLGDLETRTGMNLLTINRYSEDGSGTPTGGFYDRRQMTGLDVIEMDVGVLSDLINNPEGVMADGSDPWDGEYRLDPSTGVDWNGIVYVELPFDDSDSTRADRVMPADRKVALRLSNAKEVPNPDFASDPGFDPGFTLATNGQLYVKGHFNADGLSSTGSSTAVDSSDEAPAALFADAITMLSNRFDDSKTKLSPSKRKAEFTEVSGALVTGLLPTVPGGTAQSGGAHNLPRFLEKWSGKEFRYRGSLVALYESESGLMPMTSGHSAWYSPPKRNWGYNELFGNFAFPPGTPNVRDFRRTDFRLLTESEYRDALEDLDGFSFETSNFGHGSGG